MSRYLGLMSGTSIDAIDAALVEIDGAGHVRLDRYAEFPYPPALATDLHVARRQAETLPLDQLYRLDLRVAEAFAASALSLLHDAGVDSAAIRAIGSHGQTLCHHPHPAARYTVQVGDPNVIAARTGIVTVADLRRMDMAVGGEGAPLAPAFHAHALRDPARCRAIVNIGGIANVTLLDPGNTAVTGFDTGPGNALMDEWTRAHRGEVYDADGRWAGSAAPDTTLLAALSADPYFARRPPKSTGREYFNAGWLARHLDEMPVRREPAVVQATLLQLTARTIARAIEEYASAAAEVYVCGGGAYNAALMRAIAGALDGRQVATTAALGIAPNAVEAVAFAWLAHRRIEGLHGNLPAVTGAARSAVLGGLYLPPP
ncbi:MAG: Anhydro-N-acetylmuramic acid kinase [Gammaproteobacteria bacterium]|nr:Anhydro-N-acetylmuramic acid kinase [Gammaproteobacteria bacterium]